MLGQAASFHPDDIRRDQRGGGSVSRKSSVENDVVALGHDQGVFVSQGEGKRFDEIEKSIAARLDMRAMLDIEFRPKFLGCHIVSLVKERIERLEYDLLVLLR